MFGRSGRGRGAGCPSSLLIIFRGREGALAGPADDGNPVGAISAPPHHAVRRRNRAWIGDRTTEPQTVRIRDRIAAANGRRQRRFKLATRTGGFSLVLSAASC